MAVSIGTSDLNNLAGRNGREPVEKVKVIVSAETQRDGRSRVTSR